MSRAVLSIGSNLGEPLNRLRGATSAFSPYLRGASPVFRTLPRGPIEQQPFLNAILIVVDEQASPMAWLERAQAAEREAGRTRELRWGPRTLDVDVIAVDDVISEDPVLTLPHPRAAQRAFVLVPWWSLDPEAELPGQGSVLELMGALPDDELASVTMLPGVGLRP